MVWLKKYWTKNLLTSRSLLDCLDFQCYLFIPLYLKTLRSQRFCLKSVCFHLKEKFPVLVMHYCILVREYWERCAEGFFFVFFFNIEVRFYVNLPVGASLLKSCFGGTWLLSSPVRCEVNENHEWLVFFAVFPQKKRACFSNPYIYMLSM